ncbi:MAG: hypothetical protein IJX65_00320 [Alistipes sp.]|nr:hypothetical protein [Alistipes sp.]
MRRLLLILLCAILLSFTALGQEPEQYRYFKFYEPTDESEPLISQSDTVIQTLPHPTWGQSLFEQPSAVVNDHRGVNYYDQTDIFNGIRLPKISHYRARRLGLQSTLLEDVSARRYTVVRPKTERTQVGLSLATRGYRVGVSGSTAHSIGERSILLSDISMRTGRDAHIKGVYTNDAQVNLALMHTPDSLSSLYVALLFNPSERAVRRAAYGQCFELTGDRYYNPAWGYQDSKVRSANVITTLQPTAVASYSRDFARAGRLNVSLAATVGSRAHSGLDYLNAATPLPDNYRYLPDYFTESEAAEAVTTAWATGDSRYTQIDFDELHRRNRLQPHAVYLMNNRVTRTTNLQLSASLVRELNSYLRITYGATGQYDRRRSFKRATDLLSGGAFEDIDYYLVDDDSYSSNLQNDLNNPGRTIGKSDRYGYDYALVRSRAVLFAQVEYTRQRFALEGRVEVGGSRTLRRGYFRKELFADNSYGRSEPINFADYALRLSADFRPQPNHHLYGSVTVAVAPPEAENLFLQSQYNHRAVTNSSLSTLYAANVGYELYAGELSLRTALFARYQGRGTEVMQVYYDPASQFADIVTTNVATLAAGVEVEARYRVARHWNFTLAATAGRYRYAGTPVVTVYADRDNALLAQDSVAGARKLRTGRTPGVSVAAEIEYFNRGWGVTLSGAYHALRYVSPSLVRRTESILSHAATEQARAELVAQQNIGSAATANIMLSKSIYLKSFDRRLYSTAAAPKLLDRHPYSRITISVIVNNLLGTDTFIYRAYESSRIRRKRLWQSYSATAMPAYQLYAYPRTYALHIKVTF